LPRRQAAPGRAATSTRALLDEARHRPLGVINIKNDWKRVFEFEK
jgi:hypothetical protein